MACKGEMGCEHFRGDLAASLYGDLSRAEQAALDRHVAGCAACRTELAELRATVEALRLPSLTLTARERAWRGPARRPWLWIAGAAAAALLAVTFWPSPPAARRESTGLIRGTPAPPPAPLPEIERPKDMPLPPAPPPPVPVPVPAASPVPAPVPVPDSVPAPVPPPVHRPTVAAVARFEGKDVFPGDTLSTPGELLYGDGTRVRLGPGGELREDSGPDGLRVHLLRGELRAAVAKQPAGKPFRVVSGQSTATVLGTVLRVARRGDLTRLEVHEGKVNFDGLDVPAGRFIESGHARPRPARSTYGLLALYTFSEGQGRRVHDRAGRLDLVIGAPQRASWTPEGLRVSGTPLISSEGPARGLFEACRTSNALTLEAWVTPERASFDMEGALVAFAEDAGRRNVSLLQGAGVYRASLRTSAEQSLDSPRLAAPRLTHVVFTRNARGLETLYVDGLRRVTRERPGALGWSPDYRLELGDERTQERPWSGTFRLVAIYGRALGPAEVARNFSVGGDGW